MKTKIYLISAIFLLITCSVSSSYGYQWEKTFGGSSGQSVKQTSDGGYIISGLTYYGHYVTLIKTDNKGEEIWHKIYIDDKVDEPQAYSVQQTSDGGYIIAGMGYKDWAAFLLKTDSNGNEIWSKNYPAEHFSEAVSVEQTADGGYVFVGSYQYTDSGGHVWLVKTDSSGDVLWDKELRQELYPGIPWSSNGESLKKTNDGGYIIAASMWLIKTNQRGDQVWSKSYPRLALEAAQQTNDGGYAIIGDNKLIKTDETGNKIWEKSLSVIANDFQQTSDGGYIIVGKIRKDSTCFVLLIKTDAYGNESWRETFGGSSYCRGNSVQQTKDGGYIITGEKGSGIPLIYYNPEEPVPPGQATLTSPSGTITEDSPAYTWNAVSDSTWYYLWVNDDTGNMIKKWYTADDADCGNGTGECSVTPTTVLADGTCRWWIQTWNEYGYGPWSDAMAFTVDTGTDLPPGQATLTSPSGTIADDSPTYTWNAVSDSTWYYLWVNDDTGNKIKKWYTADQANCGNGTGQCSVKPATELSDGTCRWWIQTWNEYGYGPWSDAMAFTVDTGTDLPPGQATLTSPSGTIADDSPTYTWNAVADSTWYYLWVNDNTGTMVKKWYTADDANCGGGTGQCSVTPTTVLADGTCRWWIQTWNEYGYGPWSDAMAFTVDFTRFATLRALIARAL